MKYALDPKAIESSGIRHMSKLGISKMGWSATKGDTDNAIVLLPRCNEKQNGY